MFELKYQTPFEWTEAVLADFDAFLQDHAAAEKKAAGMAMAMLSHYPDRQTLVRAMADLAIEEMIHFKQVVKLLQARDVHLSKDEKDPYIKQVRALFRNGPPEGSQFRLGQMPVVLGGRHLDDASQWQGRVDLDEQLLDRVVVDLLDVLPDALRRLRRSSQVLDDREHVGGPDAAQRLLADRWPYEALEPGLDLVPIGLGPGHQALPDPAPRERLKLVGSGRAFLRLLPTLGRLLATNLGGVYASLQERPQFEVPRPSVGHAEVSLVGAHGGRCR